MPRGARSSYSAGTLLLAAGFEAASHALYCGYNLIGRHETGHGLPARTVVGVGFTCYAFHLNLGSLVGGVALRYRLYARLGLNAEVTTRILALSLLTNWLGYFCVVDSVFLLAPPPMPPGWELGSEGLRWVGAALLFAAAAYVAVCFLSKRREWQLRGFALCLPSDGRRSRASRANSERVEGLRPTLTCLARNRSSPCSGLWQRGLSSRRSQQAVLRDERVPIRGRFPARASVSGARGQKQTFANGGVEAPDDGPTSTLSNVSASTPPDALFIPTGTRFGRCAGLGPTDARRCGSPTSLPVRSSSGHPR